MSTETGINRHKQDKIQISNDLYQQMNRCMWIKRYPCFHSERFNMMHRSVQVINCFIMNSEPFCSVIFKFLQKSLRFYYHQMHIQWLFGKFLNTFYYGKTKGDIRHKNTVHDIQVKPVGVTPVDHVNIFLQVPKVC